jgi:hypothetical protein
MKNILLKHLIILFIFTISASVIYSQKQSDSSDAVWSIVVPKHSGNDIDMKKCLLGSKKDSVIENFISNIGSYKFRVDSVYFSGSDASCFKLVSGFPPFIISVGSSKNVEIRFTPNRIGLHQAVVNIVTQFDTLELNIYGEGVEQSLDISSEIIDFGQVEIGDFKDTIAVVVTNLLNKPVTIENSLMVGPDKIQFEILSGGGSFILKGKESKQLQLRFIPNSIGRTSGQIGFVVTGNIYPLKTQLFGQGIGMKVYCTSDSGYPGDKKDIYLKYTGSYTAALKDIVKGFKAKIRFLNTVITPTVLNIEHQNDNCATIDLQGDLSNSNTLSKIEFLAGLGNTDITSLEIIDFKWLDSNGRDMNYESETYNGTFKILGICIEGGKRFINPSGIANITKIKPNPASENIEIEIEICEKDRTILEITDVTGALIKTILNENISDFGKHSFNVNLNEFNSGIYFIRLQTPTVVDFQKILIVK